MPKGVRMSYTILSGSDKKGPSGSTILGATGSKTNDRNPMKKKSSGKSKRMKY